LLTKCPKSSEPTFLASVANGLKLFVRVTPKSSQNALGETFTDADGKCYLKVAVSAPPAEGAANAALIKTLAKTFALPPSAFSIISGLSSRKKVVLITGNNNDLRKAICAKL
jgi:hypothetical protein